MNTETQLSAVHATTRPQPSTADHLRAEPFSALVERLSRKSVDKHFEAYRDVDWDCEDFRICPDDPRWQLPDRALVHGPRFWVCVPMLLRSGTDEAPKPTSVQTRQEALPSAQVGELRAWLAATG